MCLAERMGYLFTPCLASTAGKDQGGVQWPCSSVNCPLIANPKERTGDVSRSGTDPIPTPREGEGEESSSSHSPMQPLSLKHVKHSTFTYVSAQTMKDGS